MTSKKKLLVVIPVLIFWAAGCDQPSAKRTQKEIFIEAEHAAMPIAEEDFFSRMPQDEIHRNLNSGNMPQDEIHANLNLGEMPQDEVHAQAKMGEMPTAQGMQLESSMDKSPLRWTTPKGWFEKKGSGMRVATFTNDNDTQPIETTIVSLAGSAGGLNSNITRWMGQINIPVPDSRILDNFIQGQEKIQTASGWSAVVIDFAQLQPGAADNTPSMTAAVIDRGQSQIFVKMTGSKKSVLDNLVAFKSLVQSIGPAL